MHDNEVAFVGIGLPFVSRRGQAEGRENEQLTARPNASSNVRRETFNSSARSRMMGPVNVSALTKLCRDQAGSSGLLAVFLVNAGSDGIAYRSAMKNAAH